MGETHGGFPRIDPSRAAATATGHNSMSPLRGSTIYREPSPWVSPTAKVSRRCAAACGSGATTLVRARAFPCAPARMAAMDEWPFDQPPNCAVITLRQIANGSQPVLHVTHDDADHGWQFLGLEDAIEEDASVVGFAEIVAMDPSLKELADLPPGWHAWRRAANTEWIREPLPTQDL